jgi:hypothetical protein
MPRNSPRSDALTERLRSVGCDPDSLPRSAFVLLEELVDLVQELERRLAQVEQIVVPSAIPLPASLFDEVFADEEEAEERP